MEINQKSKSKYVRINRNILAQQVRVIDKDGLNLGVMSVYNAQDLANKDNLDLVEIVPEAKPPVCSIMDFGKWKFDEKKKQKELRSKQKSVEPKAVRLRPVSNDHDIDIKIEQLKKFLIDKKTCFVNMRFKNRELAHRDNGRRIMDRIIKGVEEVGRSENEPRFDGMTLSMRLVPKPRIS